MSDITQLYTHFQNSTGISTDTRTLLPGNIYFALSGENFNGNDYILTALEKGAAYCVSSDARFSAQANVWVVENTLVTLQQLANYHRQQLAIPVIGITGSNGKTTTKELLAGCLSTKYATHFTKGNLNNHIGVPLTLLQITPETEIAIIEMGANHIGEIAALCLIAEPTHGVITNIGDAHLEGFGSPQGVFTAKSELADYIYRTRGVFFINETENSLLPLLSKIPTALLYHDSRNMLRSEFTIKKGATVPVLEFTLDGIQFTTQLAGGYNYNNILTAIALSDYFNIEPKDAATAISNYTPANNRSQWSQYKNAKILMDAYNANPSSMKQALDNFARIDTNKKSVILGDMKELGSYSLTHHQAILDQIEQLGCFQNIYLIGPEFYQLRNKYPEYSFFIQTSDFKPDWTAMSGHFVLLKGSRGIRLEALLRETD